MSLSIISIPFLSWYLLLFPATTLDYCTVQCHVKSSYPEEEWNNLKFSSRLRSYFIWQIDQLSLWRSRDRKALELNHCPCFIGGDNSGSNKEQNRQPPTLGRNPSAIRPREKNLSFIIIKSWLTYNSIPVDDNIHLSFPKGEDERIKGRFGAVAQKDFICQFAKNSNDSVPKFIN